MTQTRVIAEFYQRRHLPIVLFQFLKCFVDGGLDATTVDTPFLLLTGSAMSLSIADVRIVDGAGPDSIINCR